MLFFFAWSKSDLYHKITIPSHLFARYNSTKVTSSEVPSPNPDKSGTEKGVGWNQAETLALARGATTAYTNPVHGSNLRTAQLTRMIHAEFVKDTSRPKSELINQRKGGLLDQRRWDG